VSTAVQIETAAPSHKWQWSLHDVFADLRVRYGIKLGLAGLLALYVAQILRLPHDNWATLTVLVMMSAQYVGSIAVKAIMRVLGTIAGAIVGVWLVGNYSSTPAIFLPLLFLVMAIASYKFGQYGVRQVPYSYFLLGLTTLTIATNGVTAPDQAWQLGLDRSEEIVAGIMCSLLVNTILWPRYAREEFVAAARNALKRVGELVLVQAGAYTRGATAPTQVEQIRQDFGERSIALKNLLQVGSRESTFFSARLSNYNAYFASMISLFHGALYLTRGPQLDAPIVERLRNELQLLTSALSEEVAILTAPHKPGQKLPPGSLLQAFASLENKVIELRNEGFLTARPIETAIAFAGHFAALRSLCDELTGIRSTMGGLPRFGQPLPEPKPHWHLLPSIDWFWVKIAIKSGLAAVIAILLLKWIHPPGPAALPTIAWLFSMLGRPLIRAGGSGDLRVFQNAFFASLALVGCVVLLWLVTPLVASYTTMNVTLFLVLFGFGFTTARTAGITFRMQIAYFVISTFVGLNPQVPVSSQNIIDSFLGIIVGMFIAVTLGRALWPVLPQTLLRADLLAIFADTKALLSGKPDREKTLARLAILPIEALQAIRRIRMPHCSEKEKINLAALVRELQAAAARINHLLAHKDALPEVTAPILRVPLEQVEYEFGQLLDAYAECFRQGDCRRDLPTLQGAMAGVDHAVQQIRDQGILAEAPIEAPLQMLDLVGRYHATASALEECGRLIRQLVIHRYQGDYAL
jgi:uncharacterized membrane protein YgaE (UPF0421/DUF939 family)